MTAVTNPGPDKEGSANIAGGPYAAWANSAGTALIGPTGGNVILGGGVALSAGTNSTNTGTVVFSNSNNMTFGMGANGVVTGSFSAAAGGVGLYDGANSITSGTVSLVGNNATWSVNGQTLSLSVAAQSNQTVASGNIAGTGFSSTSTAGVVMVGTNNTAGLNVGVPAWITTAMVSNAGSNFIGLNTAATNAGLTANSSGISVTVPATSSLVGVAGASVAVNGSTLSISNVNQTRYIYPIGELTAISAFGNASLSFQYVPVFWPVSASRVDALVSWSASSSATANTCAVAISAYCAIYSTNVSSLSSLSSGSTQTTYSYASNSAGQTQLISAAIRPISVPVNINMVPGEYIVGFNIVTAASSIGTATTNLAQTLSVMGGNQLQSAANYAEFTVQTNSTSGLVFGMGLYSAASTGMPASVSINKILQTGANLSQANIALVFRNV